MSETQYSAFDQEAKLGSPPWSSKDPKLIAWESAHGHDVRLKCYPEFGCPYAESDLSEKAAAFVRAYDAAMDPKNRWFATVHQALGELRAELKRWGHL